MKAKLLLIAGLLFIVTSTKSQNIIKDGSFSTTTTIQSYFIIDETNAPTAGVWWAWQNWLIDAGATVNSSGVCKYHLNSIGAQKNIWDIQLNQTGFALIKGHSYRLTFDVWADAERSFGVYLGQDGGWWHGYLSEAQHKQIATTISTKKTIEFVADEVFPSHKLSFELGEEKIDTYFDNVVLQDLSVSNTNTGFSYSTIQAAIDAPETLNGHTLVVAPGVYKENVLVDKELTILGPKAGVDGNDGSRGSGEAIVHPAVINYGDGVYWASGGKIFNITADNVTIDGFTIDGDNPTLPTAYILNGASIDCESGISSHGGYAGEDPDLAGDNLVIKNNIFKNLMGYGIIMWGAYTNTTSQSAEITHNKFQNIFLGAGVWLGENYYATIENNAMSDVTMGIVIYWYWLSNTSTYPGTVKNNSITTRVMERSDGALAYEVHGIHIDFLYNEIADDSWVVSDNVLNHSPIRSKESIGILALRIEAQNSLVLSNNNIINYDYGYLIYSSGYNWVTPRTFEVSGGSVTYCNYGLVAASHVDPPTGIFFSPYRVSDAIIANNIIAGINITSNESIYPYWGAAQQVSIDIQNCKINNNAIGIRVSGDKATVTAHNNDLSGASSFAINNLSSNTVDATCNWYGHWTGPTTTANPGGMGTKVSSNVSFDPWVTNGTDYNLTTPGFQPVPGSCVPIKCGNKNKSYLFCHKGKTICTGYDDALIHIAHGDAFGACPGTSYVNSAEKVSDETTVLSFKVSNFPNPFSSSTRIQYQLPADSKVMLKVFDMTGKEVMVLVNSDRKAGLHSVDFNASGLGSGIYYYKLTANSKDKEYVQTGKLVKQ